MPAWTRVGLSARVLGIVNHPILAVCNHPHSVSSVLSAISLPGKLLWNLKLYTVDWVDRCCSRFRQARPLSRQRYTPQTPAKRMSETFFGRCKFKILDDMTGTWRQHNRDTATRTWCGSKITQIRTSLITNTIHYSAGRVELCRSKPMA